MPIRWGLVAAVCIGVSAAVLFAVGIWLDVVYRNNLTGSIAQDYNTQVTAWIETGFNDFQLLAGNFLFSANGTLPLYAVINEPDSPAVDAGSLIQEYANRVFYTQQALGSADAGGFFPPLAMSSSSVYRDVALAFNTTFPVIGNGTIVAESVPVGFVYRFAPCDASDTQEACQQVCAAKGATWEQGDICMQWFILNEVCYVINPLTLRPDSAGVGCATISTVIPAILRAQIHADAHNLAAYNYVPFAALPPPQSFADLSVTVRSSADPYVTALRITNGDPSDFGLVYGLWYRVSIAMIAVGIVGTLGLMACVCVRSLNTEKGGGGSAASGGGMRDDDATTSTSTTTNRRKRRPRRDRDGDLLPQGGEEEQGQEPPLYPAAPSPPPPLLAAASGRASRRGSATSAGGGSGWQARSGSGGATAPRPEEQPLLLHA